MKKRSFETVKGNTTEERCETLGIKPGMMVDFRDLLKVQQTCLGIDIVLYFEEDRARESRYEDDLEEFRGISDHERPFILLPAFVEFVKESDPEFIPRLDMFPMGVEIVSTGEHTAQGTPRPLVKALLPFAEELGEWAEEEAE